jgi:hypothetical protein
MFPALGLSVYRFIGLLVCTMMFSMSIEKKVGVRVMVCGNTHFWNKHLRKRNTLVTI